MESIETGGKVATGHGFCWEFAPGATFEITDHYSDSMNNEKWVVTNVHHVVSEATELGGESDAPMYSNSFTCMDKETKVKPPRKTPRPIIAGIQTARVTVAKGEGDPDGHGRIKVEFHWVAKGRGRGPGNSCWVRVAQPFAGPKYGFQYVPQNDDEVIIAFVDGDPDFPMIIGSTHNGKNKYPWDLPTNWTQSGFRTRAKGSGKWGEVSNVLRFEDKGGKEEVWINAAKDQLVQVAYNDKMQVGNDQDQEVVMNRNRKVGMNETVKIGMHQHTKAGTKITLECGASKITMDPMSIKIESMMITIKASLTLDEEGLLTTVKGNALLTLKGGIIFIN
jgi:type VI secretion system secreted protein VgrG